MYKCCRRFLRTALPPPTAPDGRQYTPQVTREVGAWLYTKEVSDAFSAWCKKMGVQARGNIKIASSPQYARAVRASKRIYPGEAIITMPLMCGLNFLTVAKLMYDTPHQFPLAINWMNWNSRLSYLPGASTQEVVSAGWMCRINALAEQPWAPYIHWLLQDTSGRHGIANGISQDRGDQNSQLDELLTNMANDSCEDAEDFLENFFRSVACIMLRSTPIPPAAVSHFLPGTNFFKAKSNDLFVPTLFPLVDAVVQVDNGLHNCLVDYFPSASALTDAVLEELSIPAADLEKDRESIGTRGLIALRAMSLIEAGEYLSLRAWPKTEFPENEQIASSVLEQTRLYNNARS